MSSARPSSRSHPRIGLLCDALSRYQMRIAGGARRAALNAGADIVCFFGGNFTDSGKASQRFDASFVYDLAHPPAVDGLVAITTVLANEVGVDYVRRFCEKSGLPVVSVGCLPGVPHVRPDNESGLRSLVEHLIEDHHREQFAFIRGCEGNPESIERESAFRAVLAAHGLPVREDLFMPGTFVQVSGALAVRALFDERRLRVEDLDAIVAVNDQTAIGAIRELSVRGHSVPDDVAVTGFDDDDGAAFTQPPLTTVRQPLERIGQRAVELLLELLQGRGIPEQVLVPTTPVLRCSCGCPRRKRGIAVPADVSRPIVLPTLERLRVECREAATPLFGVGPSTVDRGSDALLDGLTQALAGHAIDLEPFAQAVSKTATDGDDPLRWQDILRLVEAEVERQEFNDPDLVARGRWFLIQAQLVVNEAAVRALAAAQELWPHHEAALEVLNGVMMSAESEDALTQILTAALPPLGIRFCCICLFEDAPRERSLVRVIAAYDATRLPAEDPLPGIGACWALVGRISPAPADAVSFESPVGLVFPTENLLPDGLHTDDAATFLSVHPLAFARKPLGYAVFDLPWRHGQPWTSSDIVEHLSNAVYVLRQAEHLRHARSTAEAASIAKSEFVARMSHEIRTPLTAVMGYLDLCLRRIATPHERRYLMQAQASSKVLLGVLNDVLDFSKIEAQRMEVERAQFDLDQVVDQVVATCAPAAFVKNLELVLDVDPRVPKTLLGDPLRLTQVLVNLVGNAVKFTRAGEVVLSVEIAPPEDGEAGAMPAAGVDEASHGPILRFCVRDTGIGIAPESLSKLMAPFIQADNSTTRRYGGTGLGLAISQRLVYRMGGSLNLKSELGRGTECSFLLEFSRGDEVQSMPAFVKWPDLRVCVVDDNSASLGVVARMLAEAGLRVTTAAEGQVGIDLVREAQRRGDPFQLLLLDQGLPNDTGSDVVRKLLDMNLIGDCRVLIMAPLGELESPATLLAPDAVSGVVSKPVRRSALLGHLHNFFGQSECGTAAELQISIRPNVEIALAGKRVLLVQDDESSRLLAKELLENAGLEVHAVENGVQAVQRVAEVHYDAVLMDLHLPVMDGCEATRVIRQNGADLPIIAVTASASAEDRGRCFGVGMNDYLQMPIDSMDLLTVLAKWLQARRGGKSERASMPRPSPAPFVRPVAGGLLDSPDESTASLDVRGALRRLRGNAVLYRRLLRRFEDSHCQTAQKLRLQASQEERIRVVHMLGSAAANIGALALQRAAQALEAGLRCGKDGSQAEWARLEALLATTLEVVATARGSSTAPPPTSANRDKLHDDLVTLAGLLDSFDAAATDIVDKLTAVADSDAINEELRRIQRAVRAYDFEGAGQRVRALLATLPSSSPEPF